MKLVQQPISQLYCWGIKPWYLVSTSQQVIAWKVEV
jgi:hypothetical protein